MSVLQFPRLARTREQAAEQLADLTAGRADRGLDFDVRQGVVPRSGDPACDRLRTWPGQTHECPGPGCTYPLMPPGVLGYVVLTTPGWSDVAMLTHTGVMTRDEAEVEAARWLSSGRHVTICTVTEAMAQP